MQLKQLYLSILLLVRCVYTAGLPAGNIHVTMLCRVEAKLLQL
jgi:hypothetical protein